MTSADERGSSRKAGAERRVDRLAAALKENLKRRKEQARARKQAPAPEAPVAPASKDRSEA